MNVSRLCAAALACALAAGAAVAQQKAPAGPLRSAPAASADANPYSSNPQKETDAELAAGGWLTLLDRGDWGTAWEGSASLFRSSVPLANWMDNIPSVRKPWGALLERTPVETHYRTSMPGRPPGEYVTSVFASKFEHKQVHEVVTTVLEPDGRWRVTGYSPR